MKRVLCPHLPAPGRSVQLPEAEADHLVRVLRLRDGDMVEAMDGHGHAALTTLRVQGGPPRLEFKEKSRTELQAAQQIVPVTLEMAVLKGDAMEWVVEKAVELGVETLVPVLTAHTVVQTKNKGPEVFQQRWQKIADQALKQCGRLNSLKVLLPINLEELLRDHPTRAETPRLWCDEGEREVTPYLADWLGERQAAPKGYRLLIGPEGGWSDLERDLLGREPAAGLARVSLGPLVLRAETAALMGMSLLTAQFRSRNGLDKNLKLKGNSNS